MNDANKSSIENAWGITILVLSHHDEACIEAGQRLNEPSNALVSDGQSERRGFAGRSAWIPLANFKLNATIASNND